MSSGLIEPKPGVGHDEKVDIHESSVLKNPDLMGEAFDGENHEHEQGVWEAFKSHKWACFWAFTMCFTIVSSPSHISHVSCSPHARFSTMRRGCAKRAKNRDLRSLGRRHR